MIMATDHSIQAGRRLAQGAEVGADGVHFRIWAPERRQVTVVLEGDAAQRFDRPRSVALAAEADGYFAALVPGLGAGALYRYRLDDLDLLLPDPASRFQPEGPHGPSQVIDPAAFAWTDHNWPGVGQHGQILYEMHVGTFTPEGTYAAAMRELEGLVELGVTMLEIMPVADFPGQFGWGYDGVNLYAPTRLYGSPDDLRRFVDRAHSLGLAIILDVVYNHLGPDGNYLGLFSAEYFTERYKNEWGQAINFDGDKAGPVREFFAANAGYWIDEFHMDGLRLDATQQIFDSSPDNIMAVMARRVRAAARGRTTYLVAENEPQESKLVRAPEAGGHGLDSLWNDDFHHSAMVALTGRNDAYYSDYLGRPQEFIAAAKYGYMYQGQYYVWQKHPRGTPCLDLPPACFVNFIQNHDQIANSGSGERAHQLTSPGRFRAMTALLLLSPGTPMLFQGQEFAASSPFFYFADHNEELACKVSQGRVEFLSQFRNLATPEMQARLPTPSDPATFQRCKLNHAERQSQMEAYLLHRDLIRLRKQDAVFAQPRPGGVDGAVLGREAFLLRFFGAANQDRLLLVNFGRDIDLRPAPEPLLAPPAGQHWVLLWSSEDPLYGGGGTPPLESEGSRWLPGEAAVVLTSQLRE